jgi:hypothetical protein
MKIALNYHQTGCDFPVAGSTDMFTDKINYLETYIHGDFH